MKKILFLFLLISQTLSAQNDLMLLSKSFKEIKLPYYTSQDYFPLVGYDESLEVEYEIGPLENGLVKEITSIFKDYYPAFNPKSRYYSIGKFSHKNLNGIVFYQVITDPETSYIYGVYNLAIYNKDNKFLGEKVIGQQPDSNMGTDDVLMNFINFSEIKLVEDNLVIFTTYKTEVNMEDGDGNWNEVNTESYHTKIVFNQAGEETETSL